MGLPSCILCRSFFEAKTAKPEHVLLNALGGRKTVKNVICSNCNQSMGNGPDEDLAKSVKALRNYGNLNSGDVGHAPKIIGHMANGQRFDLLPGGGVESHPMQPLQFNDREDGTEVSIIASNEKHADQLANGAAKRLAKQCGRNDPASITKLYEQIKGAMRSRLSDPPIIRHSIELGSGRSQQSMAKATLVLWANLVGNVEVLDMRYDAVRQFICQSKRPAKIEPPTKIDLRSLPPLSEKYGSCPCIVWAGSDNEGKVFGYFRLYGMVGWRINLGQAPDFANEAICLISNPFDPCQWDEFRRVSCPIKPDWILKEWDSYADKNDNDSDGTARLLEELSLRSNTMIIDNLFFEAVSESGLEEGQAITDQHIRFISKYIAVRLVASGPG